MEDSALDTRLNRFSKSRNAHRSLSQLAFSCSKLMVEAPEQCVKSFQI